MTEKPIDKPPPWLVPAFTFCLGCASTAALLVPNIATPDYQRGHEDGYKMCHKEMAHNSQEDAAEALRGGIQMGYDAAIHGRPLESVLPARR